MEIHLVRTSTFQFHKGTIRTVVNVNSSPDVMYFNSIKVRLEPIPKRLAYASLLFQFHKGTIRTFAGAKALVKGFSTFQFHKGTIRTPASTWHKIRLFAFQFHKGTIRTILTNLLRRNISYFNSIKVRLELPAVRVPKDADLFQFHKGTIRT